MGTSLSTVSRIHNLHQYDTNLIWVMAGAHLSRKMKSLHTNYTLMHHFLDSRTPLQRYKELLLSQVYRQQLKVEQSKAIDSISGRITLFISLFVCLFGVGSIH